MACNSVRKPCETEYENASSSFALRKIIDQAEESRDQPRFVPQCGHGQIHRDTFSILAHRGPFVFLGKIVPRPGCKHFESRLNRFSQIVGQLLSIPSDFFRIANIKRITATPLAIKAESWRQATPEISFYLASIYSTPWISCEIYRPPSSTALPAFRLNSGNRPPGNLFNSVAMVRSDSWYVNPLLCTPVRSR